MKFQLVIEQTLKLGKSKKDIKYEVVNTMDTLHLFYFNLIQNFTPNILLPLSDIYFSDTYRSK